MTAAITSFQGEHRFLSNFAFVFVSDGRFMYSSTEAGYQAAKTIHPMDKAVFVGMKPGAAKRFGRKITMRPDWDEVKLAVMFGACAQKFACADYAAQLRNTGDAELIEGNTWGDRFWGVCDGVGENNLGKILMQIRAELVQ